MKHISLQQSFEITALTGRILDPVSRQAFKKRGSDRLEKTKEPLGDSGRSFELSSDCNAISIASSKNAVLDFSFMDEAKFEALPGTREGVRVIRISGPFTLRNVMEFQAIFRDGDSPVTIVDLSAVPYLDSAALGTLISVHTSAQRHQRKYALTGVADRLKVIMEMTGVANLLVMYPAITDAEEKLA